jgi:hypothetical protein
MPLLEFMLLLPMLAFVTFVFALLAVGWKVTIPLAFAGLLTSIFGFEGFIAGLFWGGLLCLGIHNLSSLDFSAFKTAKGKIQ